MRTEGEGRGGGRWYFCHLDYTVDVLANIKWCIYLRRNFTAHRLRFGTAFPPFHCDKEGDVPVM